MTRLPRTAASHALHEGLETVGDARLMAQTAAGHAADAAARHYSPVEGDTERGRSSTPGGPRSQSASTPGWRRLRDCRGARRRCPGAEGSEAGPRPAPPAPPAARRRAAASDGQGPSRRGRPVAPDLSRTDGRHPDDAWKWEGVPPGRSLIGPVEPGKMRHYMGDDGHGPQIVSLPPSWPPGATPDRRAAAPGAGCERTTAGPATGSAPASAAVRWPGGGPGQILTVALGLLFGVLALRWEPNALGVAAAIGILVLYGALATVPVAGRTGDEWLPVALCWGRAGPGAAGSTAGGAGPDAAALRGVQSRCAAGWHDMGVVHDRAGAHADRRPGAARRAASRCSAPTSRTAGWGHGRRCWPRSPGRARRCAGCSGWRRPSPTTVRVSGRISPPRPCRTRPRPARPRTSRCSTTWTRAPVPTTWSLALQVRLTTLGRGRVRHPGP